MRAELEARKGIGLRLGVSSRMETFADPELGLCMGFRWLRQAWEPGGLGHRCLWPVRQPILQDSRTARWGQPS